jgi:hypothetical protein
MSSEQEGSRAAGVPACECMRPITTERPKDLHNLVVNELWLLARSCNL